MVSVIATKYHLKIDQGCSFYRKLTWTDKVNQPINTSGYTAKLQIKQFVNSKTTIIELTTLNDGITISNAGVIEIKMTPLQTKLLVLEAYVYDLVLTDTNTNVIKLIEGNVQVSRTVSL